MAGTIFGLGLSQQTNALGRPLGGALLYLYETNTSTPVDAFSDFALSSAHQHPIVADSAGRLPAFWLDDGTYRVRLTTSAGVTVFDEAAITAIGPSSGDSGGSAAVNTETIFQTGDTLWVPVSAARTGWVRCNGMTISSGAGSGTQRANGDVEALFAYLWNNFSDAICPVGTGRGASATADFNANKAIATLDLRGKAPFGLDTMGNSAASIIAGGTTAGTNGTTAGAATVALAQANLPNVNFTVSGTGTGTYSGTVASHTHTGPSHTHTAGSFAVSTTLTNGTNVTRTSTYVNNVSQGADGEDSSQNDVPADADNYTVSLADGSVSGTSAAGGTGATGGTAPACTGTISVSSLTATAASGGSATATNNLPPYVCGSWYMKL
jgi:hypothetical protein